MKSMRSARNAPVLILGLRMKRPIETVAAQSRDAGGVDKTWIEFPLSTFFNTRLHFLASYCSSHGPLDANRNENGASHFLTSCGPHFGKAKVPTVGHWKRSSHADSLLTARLVDHLANQRRVPQRQHNVSHPISGRHTSAFD